MEGWEQKVLLKFSQDPRDFWTVDDAMKGCSVTGGTGSGKTSGSGKKIALKFLQQGWGGLVLCAKSDEAKQWKEYAEATGRKNDLVVFGNNSRHPENDEIETRRGKTIVFNPLQYELTRAGEGAGDVFNITSLFMNLQKMANRASNDGEGRKDDRFWDNALKRIISRTIELIKFAGEELTFKNIVDLLHSAPTEKAPFDEKLLNVFVQKVPYDEGTDQQLKENTFLRCLAKSARKIVNKDADSPEVYMHDTLRKYFTSSLPNMSEHTHSAIIESFMGVAEPFLSGILCKHFAGETTLKPEEIFTKNKIIVLDFPVKEYLDAGIMAQCVFKMLFQQAVERRKTDDYPTPVFLWADEAQYFISPYDQIFLTTARSSRTATVFLSQNISNYYAVMGGSYEGKPKVDSLMGNLSTKIFHANSDAETNKYASTLIGDAIAYLAGKSSSKSFFKLDFSSSENISERYQPQIQPREFTMLKSGGANNDFQVEAVIFVTGKTWSTKTNFLKTAFKQSFSN